MGGIAMTDQKIDRPRYAMRIQWSDEDATYVAESLELDGVAGFGATPERAAAELNDAVDLATEFMRAQGAPLPPATTLSTYSGQFRLRVPRSMHRQLSLRAEFEGVSINTLVLSLLAGSLSTEKHEKHEKHGRTTPSVRG